VAMFINLVLGLSISIAIAVIGRILYIILKKIEHYRTQNMGI